MVKIIDNKNNNTINYNTDNNDVVNIKSVINNY